MLRFALRRAASALLTLLGVLALVFGLLAAAPGDPAAHGRDGRGARAAAVSPEALAAFRNLYGLDRPPLERFGLWIVRAARLDFGLSLSDGRPVDRPDRGRAARDRRAESRRPPRRARPRRPGGNRAPPAGRADASTGSPGALGDALFATPSFVLGLVLLLVFSGWLRLTPLFSDGGRPSRRRPARS